MLAFGYTVLHVSQQLGHSSAKVTLDTYRHAMEEGHRLDRAATLQKFDEVFRGATRVLRKREPADQINAEALIGLEPGDQTRTDDLRITSAPDSESRE
jgi:hypothetical protein